MGGTRRTVTSCGNCPQPTNGSATCADGVCGTRCNAGFHACGSSCFSDSSPTACGAGCLTCPAGPAGSTPACVNGACSYTCMAGTHLCNGQCVNNTSTARKV